VAPPTTQAQSGQAYGWRCYAFEHLSNAILARFFSRPTLRG
jgi:hypothetical protein